MLHIMNALTDKPGWEEKVRHVLLFFSREVLQCASCVDLEMELELPLLQAPSESKCSHRDGFGAGWMRCCPLFPPIHAQWHKANPSSISNWMCSLF